MYSLKALEQFLTKLLIAKVDESIMQLSLQFQLIMKLSDINVIFCFVKPIYCTIVESSSIRVSKFKSKSIPKIYIKYSRIKICKIPFKNSSFPRFLFLRVIMCIIYKIKNSKRRKIIHESKFTKFCLKRVRKILLENSYSLQFLM